MFDIAHRQETRIKATVENENAKSGDHSQKEAAHVKSVAWNQITFIPSESFSHRKKEQYQFWFNEKGELVLHDEQTKINELYERVATEEADG